MVETKSKKMKEAQKQKHKSKKSLTTKKSKSKKEKQELSKSKPPKEEQVNKSSKKAKRKLGLEREIIHPEYQVVLAIGKDAITAEYMKDLLGMTPAPKGVKGDVWEVAGERVFLTNNNRNRPYNSGLMKSYKQQMLKRRWCVNGDNIIVGKTGQLLSGQHRAIALIEAVKEWLDNPDEWIDYWETEPVIEGCVFFGIEEADEVVNTIDTGKSRSDADIIYRSDYFIDESSNARKAKSKMLAFAVQLLWKRTGCKDGESPVIRTRDETLDFIRRHKRLLKAVDFIYEEDSGKAGAKRPISKYLSPGYSAGLLYLMAAQDTDERYGEVLQPTESLINFDKWEDACDFFVLLAQQSKDLAPLQSTFAKYFGDGGGNRDERIALLIKGWVSFQENWEIDVDLHYKQDEYDIMRLAEYPVVGGIDIGEVE